MGHVPVGRAGSAVEGAVIYRATAPSPAGPWVADPEPVLGLGEAGAWDDLALDFPAVVPMGGGYLMLYGGIDGNETTRIGVATSDDGISWQKDPNRCSPRRAAASSAPAMPPGRG